MNNFDLLGLIMIVGGIFTLLHARHGQPPRPKDPEQTERWRRKMRLLGSFLILSGVVEILGIFR